MEAGRVLLRKTSDFFSHQPVSPSTRRISIQPGLVVSSTAGRVSSFNTVPSTLPIALGVSRTVREAYPTRYHFLSLSSGTDVGGSSGIGGGGVSILSRSLLKLQPLRLPSDFRIFSQVPSAFASSSSTISP